MFNPRGSHDGWISLDLTQFAGDKNEVENAVDVENDDTAGPPDGRVARMELLQFH